MIVFSSIHQRRILGDAHIFRNACGLSAFVVLAVFAVAGCWPGQPPATPPAPAGTPPAHPPAVPPPRPAGAAAVAPTREASADKRPAPADDANAQLTEAVGLLSGLYLYQSYLNIGLLADGKAERLYDDKAARGVLESILS